MSRIKWEGSAVLEEALLFPVIMLVLCTSVWVLFYYHDKAILKAAVYETAQREIQRVHNQGTVEGTDDENGIRYFRERIAGKMIFFGTAQIEEEITKDRIIIQAFARKGWSQISGHLETSVTEPEKDIRSYRKIGGQ